MSPDNVEVVTGTHSTCTGMVVGKEGGISFGDVKLCVPLCMAFLGRCGLAAFH